MPAGSQWKPTAGETFQYQITGKTIDTSVSADIYDIDGFDQQASAVAALHKMGRHVICYIDVGTWENWRPDAKDFPKGVLGNHDGHWPGERWLDIRQLSVLEPIMTKRFEMCKQKGFDGVDPDNIDGYTNKTGFPLTAKDQLAYDQWFASEIHSLGMLVGQKNDPGQNDDLSSHFDFAVDEQCWIQHWCQKMNVYSNSNRLVVDVEYGVALQRFQTETCPEAATNHDTAILKKLNLGSWIVTCQSSH